MGGPDFDFDDLKWVHSRRFSLYVDSKLIVRVLHTKERHEYTPRTAYQNSKLANVWFTYELHRRISSNLLPQAKTVRVNALCPGFVPTTALNRNASFVCTTIHAPVCSPNVWYHCNGRAVE